MSNQEVLGPCCPPVDPPEPGYEPETTADLARKFKALGDPVRLHLLTLISQHPGGEACVCDISGGLELSQSTISHHLKVLREAGLLECERRSTWVYYWVVPRALQELSAVLASASLTSEVVPA